MLLTHHRFRVAPTQHVRTGCLPHRALKAVRRSPLLLNWQHWPPLQLLLSLS